MKTGQKSTIHDIARKAGVSPSAVSAALNGSWEKRRLSRTTVERILEVARSENYSVNLQARGLRQARSGLAGMVLPDHENRYFAELSQCFAAEAHARGLCPAIVHAGRDAAEQLRSVESLIAYAVDLVMIAGASDPPALAQACRDAHVAHVFVDHPCAEAPSVVSDNLSGAAELTRRLLSDMAPPEAGDPAGWLYFLGGAAHLPASSERIRGFRAEAGAAGALFDAEAQIRACGYESHRAEAELAALCDRLGRLPAGLFVNSIGCFEGVVRFLGGLSEDAIAACTFGCFDYDPFGTLLRFPLRMVRQRADLIVAEAYRQLDAGASGPRLVRIAPDLL
ncbi:MAG: LacI family DNA-binding transcriptional regulator [Rhodobacteraceae bacterium]|jgi:LacI family fructose operon transcriptional repressor|nr:LacI family DNA-binding transcriptional regulator [Paracoccaceae bacterium]